MDNQVASVKCILIYFEWVVSCFAEIKRGFRCNTSPVLLAAEVEKC